MKLSEVAERNGGRLAGMPGWDSFTRYPFGSAFIISTQERVPAILGRRRLGGSRHLAGGESAQMRGIFEMWTSTRLDWHRTRPVSIS